MFDKWWSRIAERMAASPVLASLQDDTADARRLKAIVVAICLLLHVGFYALLSREPAYAPRRVAERPLEIVFIAPSRPVDDAPPAMPRKSKRLPMRSLRAVHIDPPVAPAPDTDMTLNPRLDDVRPDTRDLLQQIPAYAEGLSDDSQLGVRDPMRPFKPRLPGSEVAIVEGLHVHRERTPEDVVKFVGSLFGARATCPDILGKMHDATLANPERYSTAERRDLAESERRCRYR